MKLGVNIKPEGTLFIIEAAGKKDALTKTLSQLSIDGYVFSTNGHLLSNPNSLWPSFIDARFRELRRRPINEELCVDLKIAAGKAMRVVVATDPDDEGHVIATDVAELLKNHDNVMRGLFYGFDALSVQKGMRRLSRIEPEKAVPGTVRRVIDRWIGSTFSDPKRGLSVGRVLTGTLSLMKRTPVEIGFLPVDIPAADGGGPFRGNIAVTRENKHLLERYVNELKGATPLEIERKEMEVAGVPQDHIDTILSISKKTGESIQVVQERLQRFYEQQHISYPRTDAHSYNKRSIEFAQELATKNRVEIKPELYKVNNEEHAHESVHLLKAISLEREIQYGEDQEILTHIGRMMIKAGQPEITIYADKKNLPFWAKKTDWTRSVAMNNGWRDQTPPPFQFVAYTKEQAALKFIHDNELGRPGTMVSHAVNIASKGLLTDEFNVTSKGRFYLANSPEALFKRRAHSILEYAGVAELGELHDVLGEDGITVEDRVQFALKESGLLKEAEMRILKKESQFNKRPSRPENVGIVETVASKGERSQNTGKAKTGLKGLVKKDLN